MLNLSVVLYKNSKEQINNLMNDIIQSDGNIVNKIYIIDNSPTNVLQSHILHHSKILYMHQSINLGYGAAHNIAMLRSLEENVTAHAVINPDIRFEPHVLLELLNYLNKNINVGLIMPQICYPNGDTQQLCKLIPTPISLFGRRFLPKCINHFISRKYDLLDFEFSQETNVPILSGCFMFMRTEVFSTIGLFDDRYFMYLEDFDLSRRIHAKYNTIFYPYAKVYHEYNRESNRNFKLLWVHINSAIKYFNKFGWFFDSARSKYNKEFIKSNML